MGRTAVETVGTTCLWLNRPSRLIVSTRPGNPTAAPLADLALNEPPPAEAPAAAGSAGPAGPGASAGHHLSVPNPHVAGPGRARAFDRGYEPPRHRAPEVDPLELPLFEARPATGAARDAAAREVADRPLISPSTPPRPPLAVRRTTGELPRARPRVTPGAMPPRVEEPRLELDLPDRVGLDRGGTGDFGDMTEPVLLDDPGIASRDARDRDAATPASRARRERPRRLAGGRGTLSTP